MFAAGLCLLAGCGGDPETGRIPLHGTVRVNGTLVEEGSISLLPAEGHSGPAANTSITGGEYVFSESNGPVAGPHRVVVGVVSTEDQRRSESATESALDGGGKQNALQASADGSASPPQWEMDLQARERKQRL